MKAILVAVFVFFAICFSSTEAIICYDCVYYEGHPLSDAQCQNGPSSSSAFTCSATFASKSLTAIGYYKSNDSLATFSTEMTELKQLDWILMCSTFTAKMDARAIVARKCFIGVREIVGTCRTDVYLEVEGRNATDVVGCFCTGDRCNGASVVQFTYISLVAVIIHIMYKFVSAA